MERPALLLLCAAMAACGGSAEPAATPAPPSDEAQIVALVERYNTALADGDGAAACETMTAVAQATLMGFYNDSKSDTMADQSLPDASSCKEAASGLKNVGFKVVKDAIANAKFDTVDSVEIRGEEAQANVGAAQVRLARVDGEWKITEGGL